MLDLVYRPPDGAHRELEIYFKSSLSKREISHKDVILAVDFDINLLDFFANKKVQNFLNLMFRFEMIPTINKPTHVTRQTARAPLIISSQTFYCTLGLNQGLEKLTSPIILQFSFVISILPQRKMLRRNLYINVDSLIIQ